MIPAARFVVDSPVVSPVASILCKQTGLPVASAPSLLTAAFFGVKRFKKNLSFHRRSAALAAITILSWASLAGAQTNSITGSVPSGPATNDVLRLSLRDAITVAVRYNLGSIESAQTARLARGQRLLALSSLLPQVDAAASEHVNQ